MTFALSLCMDFILMAHVDLFWTLCELWLLNTPLLFVETLLTMPHQTERKPLNPFRVLKLFNIRLPGIKTLLS